MWTEENTGKIQGVTTTSPERKEDGLKMQV